MGGPLCRPQCMVYAVMPSHDGNARCATDTDVNASTSQSGPTRDGSTVHNSKIHYGFNTPVIVLHDTVKRSDLAQRDREFIN